MEPCLPSVTGGISARFFFRIEWDAVPLELVLDFRRLLYFIAFLMRLAVVQDVIVSADSSDDELEESEELFMSSARIPGCDSSSIICWGVLA